MSERPEGRLTAEQFGSGLAGRRLSRRELLRWAGVAGISGIGTGLVSCSDPPEQEIVETSTAPTRIQSGGTVDGTVTGLFDGGVIADAVLEFVGADTVTTDAAGMFSIRLQESGDYKLKVNAKTFSPRITAVQISSNATVFISLIEKETKLTLDFLDQFARGLGGRVDGMAPRTPGFSNRWLRPPEIRLYTRVVGDPETKLSDRRIRHMTDVIDSTYVGFTAGVFGLAPRVIFVDSVPPKKLPGGELAYYQTADDSRGGTTEGLVKDRFAVASSRAYTGLEATSGVLTRVFGQALGETVVKGTQSAMNPEGRSTLTESDELAAMVLYNRTPGNQSPDKDPDGFFLNV